MTEAALISLRSVYRTFRRGNVPIPVVRDVSLDVYEGEFVAIMGPSGSGKSTLMNLIGLLDRPTSGSVLIASQDVSKLADGDKARLRGRAIGFIFQSYNLLPRANALENVELPLVYAGMSRRERLVCANEALEAVGMQRRAHHFPSQLSGGEQQRVAIARAIAGSASIVLADEPTGALDSRTGQSILELFRALHHSGRTIVMITHDPAVAARCQRVVRLQDGRVVDQIHPETNSRAVGAVA